MALSIAEKLRQTQKKRKKPGKSGLNSLSGQYMTGSSPTRRTSAEEIQSLSREKGLAAPPLTPQGAAALGATPDQAKMVGERRQTQAATRIAMAPGQDLATQTRQKQARSQATGTEAGLIEKSEALQKLGGLGDQVHSLLQAEVSKLTSAQAQFQAVDDAELLAGLDEEGKARVSELATQVAAGNMEAQVELNQLLGRDGSNPLSEQDINSLVQGDVALTTADALADQITVEGALPDLGYDSLEALAADVGLPASQLGSMSIAEFSEAVQRELDREFSQVEALEQVLSDPTSSPAERAEALATLRDLGATGLRTAERAAEDLSEQLETADEIEFAGELTTLTELLSDEGITGQVERFLVGSPEEREKLLEMESDFYSWVQTNEEGLATLFADLGETTEKFNEIQEYNQSLAKTSAGELSGSFMSALLGEGWDGLATEELDVSEYPLLELLDDPTNMPEGVDPDALLSGLDEVATLSQDAARQLAGMSKEQLAKLGIGNPNSETWPRYIENLQIAKKLADNPDLDPYDAVFGPGTANDVRVAQAIGRQLNLDVDANQDGRPDSREEILARLSDLSSVPASRQFISPVSSISRSMRASLGEALSDGVVTAAELPSLKSLLATSSDDASTLEVLARAKGMDSKAKSTLLEAAKQRRGRRTEDIMKRAARDAGIDYTKFTDVFGNPAELAHLGPSAIRKARDVADMLRRSGNQGDMDTVLLLTLERKLKEAEQLARDRAEATAQANKKAAGSGKKGSGGKTWYSGSDPDRWASNIAADAPWKK